MTVDNFEDQRQQFTINRPFPTTSETRLWGQLPCEPPCTPGAATSKVDAVKLRKVGLGFVPLLGQETPEAGYSGERSP